MSQDKSESPGEPEAIRDETPSPPLSAVPSESYEASTPEELQSSAGDSTPQESVEVEPSQEDAAHQKEPLFIYTADVLDPDSLMKMLDEVCRQAELKSLIADFWNAQGLFQEYSSGIKTLLADSGEKLRACISGSAFGKKVEICWREVAERFRVLIVAEQALTVSGATREALRSAFHPCKDPYQVCPCCDIFGMVDEDAKEKERGEVRARAGKISISPARFAGEKKESFWIEDPKILNEPKYSCRSFYLEPDDKDLLSPDYQARPDVSKDEFVSVRRKDNGEVEIVSNPIRGRKFYWHHTVATRQFQTKEEWQEYINRRDKPITQDNRDKRPPETDQNARLQALMPGAEFEFNIDFENLSPWQLGLLLWTIALPDVEKGAHHLGLGKPIGLGSVEIAIRRIQLIDRGKRYASLFATGIVQDAQANPTDADVGVDVDSDASPYREYVDAFRATMERWHKEENGNTKSFSELANIADLCVILSRNQPSHATPPSYMQSSATGNVPITYPPGTGTTSKPNEPHPEELHHKWFGEMNWSEPLLSIKQIERGIYQRRKP